MIELFTDRTTAAIEIALNGVAERQRVSSHNIANVNTPNFRSSRVRFEDELGRALRNGGDLQGVVAEHVRANTPINSRNNDVALERETQDLITAGLHYQALVEALNFKLGALRTAIGQR